jgi:amino acid transporter
MSHNDGSLILICPEFVNVALLSTGIFQMFNGIEINHPIYHILFINLIVTLVSSLITIFAFPFSLNNVKYSTVVNANNGFTLLFHCCCWAIVSALRYLYIMKKKWLEEHYPDQKQIKYLSTISLFCLFLFFFGVNVTVITMCGWPKHKIFEANYVQILISVTSVLGTYIGLLAISFVFYILIFWGPKNKVIPLKEFMKMSTIVLDESDNAGIWIGDTTLESPKSDSLINCQVTKNDLRFKTLLFSIKLFVILIVSNL